MTEQCTVVGEEENIRTVEQNWDSPLTLETNSTNRKLLSSLLSINDELDCDIDTIYNQQHINSAYGRSLDKWGDLVNVSRRTDEQTVVGYTRGFPFGNELAAGETFTVEADEQYFIQEDVVIDGTLTVDGEVLSNGDFTGTGEITGTGELVADAGIFTDDKFRARIKASFRASTIGTTYDQFTEFVSSILNTDFERIEFLTDYVSNPAAVTVRADEQVYDNVGFTSTDIDDLLSRAVPAGHTVNVLVTGTFEVKADGDSDDADKGLTADGITTGGTLSADIA